MSHKVFSLVLLCSIVIVAKCTEIQSSANNNTNENPIVHIKQGEVRGKILTSFHQKRPFNAFLGIPYGKVVRRFMSPQPADSWTGILNATRDGPPCFQYDGFIRHAIIGVEDCLTINVYTPQLPVNNSTSGLPVIVFFYGGGFMLGEATSTLYGPERYMDKDVVLVLMNFRVGPFGFLSTHDAASPGNYGLLDQVLALKWVKDNIQPFGGNPNKVTITGESAGAGSVAFHLVSPLSNGLFHRAIAQSGTALCSWSLTKNPLRIAHQIAENLECPTNNTQTMVDCIREKDAEEVLNATRIYALTEIFGFPTSPVIENPNGGQFLTESPLTLMQEGRFNKVPVMIGITEDESAPFVSAFWSVGAVPMLTSYQDMQKWKIMIDSLTVLNVNDTIIRLVQNEYFENANFSNNASILSSVLQLSSDVMFKSCNDKTVRLLNAGGVPVYMYVWNYIPREKTFSNFSGKPDVSHGMDLIFLFNWTTFGMVDNSNFSEETESFSRRILQLWTDFADSGNPTPLGAPLQWTPTPPGTIKYLNISESMSMGEGYLTERMQFWDRILYTPTGLYNDNGTMSSTSTSSNRK